MEHRRNIPPSELTNLRYNARISDPEGKTGVFIPADMFFDDMDNFDTEKNGKANGFGALEYEHDKDLCLIGFFVDDKIVRGITFKGSHQENGPLRYNHVQAFDEGKLIPAVPSQFS